MFNFGFFSHFEAAGASEIGFDFVGRVVVLS
jgi:hypothetical protein